MASVLVFVLPFALPLLLSRYLASAVAPSFALYILESLVLLFITDAVSEWNNERKAAAAAKRIGATLAPSAKGWLPGNFDIVIQRLYLLPRQEPNVFIQALHAKCVLEILLMYIDAGGAER